MLKNLSYYGNRDNGVLFCSIQSEVDNLRGYFIKFAGGIKRAEENMQRAVMHACKNYDASKGELKPYLKKLARTIGVDKRKDTPSEFLEEYMEHSHTVTGGYEPIEDFDVAAIRRLLVERREDVEVFALRSMDEFCLFCEGLKSGELTVRDFSEGFIKEGNRLWRYYGKAFRGMCYDVYAEYGAAFREFCAYEPESWWQVVDEGLLRNSLSVRVKLVKRYSGLDPVDIDNEKLKVVGRCSGRHIVKIKYGDLWDEMCEELYGGTTNRMKFVLGNNYVFRTLGGSWAVFNPEPFAYCDNIREEIFTNLVQWTQGRLVNWSAEYVYILCYEGMENNIKSGVLNGFTIDFSGWTVLGEDL